MLEGEQKDVTVRRLKRIEGQVRGIADMIDNERYCIDVLTQIAAVHEALRGVSKRVVENHLHSCVAETAVSGSVDERNEKFREFVETMYKFVR